MTPNPTALRALVKEEEVGEHRSVLCADYDDCLDEAMDARLSEALGSKYVPYKIPGTV